MKPYTETQQKIFDKITPMTIPSGLGSVENASTIAALNLSLSGELTYDIPACCSEVIGRWIIVIQDAMPAKMRNSERYKMLVPYLAGTGRAHEKERLDIILDWLMSTALPILQDYADTHGFSTEWKNMLLLKSTAAANLAYSATRRNCNYTPTAYASVNAAAACAADSLAHAQANVAYAAACAAISATNVAYAYDATRTVTVTNTNTNTITENIWETFDPISLLEKLILVSEPEKK